MQGKPLNAFVKPIFFLFLFAWLLGCSMVPAGKNVTQETTTLFIVRHAEKADDGTEDPPLTEQGTERARALASVLGDAGVEAVYATPYKRNKETAAPLAEMMGLPVNEYKPHDKEFAASLVQAESGRKILVVGHSNTVPALVNGFIGEQKFKDLQESEYDHLFMIQLGSDTTLTVLHYGATSKTVN